MKPRFIRESTKGFKTLFDMFLLVLIVAWPFIISCFIILFILNPFHNPQTVDQALKEFYWNMNTGLIYAFIVGIITIVYNFTIGLPFIECHIWSED